LDFESLPDAERLSARAADEIVREVRAKPDLGLVAATGASPVGTYAALSEIARREPGLFARLRVTKLDEWGSLAMDDPASCEATLRRQVLDPLGVAADRYLGFASDALDPGAECARVQTALAAFGAQDIALLGLGLNGHVGFNEPAESLRPHAHVARLSETSLGHPMLTEARRRPTHGLTLGMADLLACRRVLLLVSGAHKREALARLRRAEITPAFPASFLWLHPRVTCLCDAVAG
jgi:galactosamine-6-phosphate isomerase